MKLCCALSEKLHCINIGADRFAGKQGDFCVYQFHERFMRQGHLFHLYLNRKSTLKVLGQGILGKAPCVPLVWNIALQHSKGHWYAIVPAVLQSPVYLRHVNEGSLLCEETPDLKVRVRSFLQTSEELQNEFISIYHHGIAVVCTE